MCAESIQLTCGEGKIQSEESRMELTHVWSCPAMLENPGVLGEGVGLRQVKSEGTIQTECQLHTHRIHTHTQAHTRIFLCNNGPNP